MTRRCERSHCDAFKIKRRCCWLARNWEEKGMDLYDIDDDDLSGGRILGKVAVALAVEAGRDSVGRAGTTTDRSG